MKMLDGLEQALVGTDTALLAFNQVIADLYNGTVHTNPTAAECFSLYQKMNGYVAMLELIRDQIAKQNKLVEDLFNEQEKEGKDGKRMNELQVYTYEGSEIRTVNQDGEPWFVAADVCRVLELSNPTISAERLDEDERSKFNLGRQGEAIIVSEAGLYTLILGSRKPEAKAFKRWVTHEVIPSIRKHGAYMTPETLEQAILNPDTMIKLCTALKSEQEKNRQLQGTVSQLTVENTIMQPKAEYFDALVDHGSNTGIRETAKTLGVPEKVFVRFMLDKKYLYRDQHGKLAPHAEYVKREWFVLKESVNDKTGWTGIQLLITPKGKETLHRMYLSVNKEEKAAIA